MVDNYVMTTAYATSHTVAALKNGTIPNLVRWYQTLKCKPKFAKLSESDKPTTAGQKGSVRGSLKKVTQKLQSTVFTS